MAEGGTIKARLEKVQEALDAEQREWVKAELPPIGTLWRMNETEFQHHCHVEAFFRILRDHLGVSKEVCDLYYKEVILDEMRSFRAAAAEVRRQALRSAIVDGVDVYRPKPEI